MFDPTDSCTQKALLELRDIHANDKPVILWIGAGASRWAGYPTWYELAKKLHSNFIKFEANYDSKAGIKALKQQMLPFVFSLCKRTNSNRYFAILSNEFRIKRHTPVYSRFIELLKQISPLSIITTNIDESLESSLAYISTYQRSNIEFSKQLISSNQSFICKLHGTASAIDASIWTDEDYEELVADEAFVENLSRLLERASIVFVGYSLRDKYILDILSRNHSIAKLLGSGPHFLVYSDLESLSAPENVRTIRYLTSTYLDHRSALAVLDIIRNDTISIPLKDTSSPQAKISAIYIPDYLTHGTYTTSQTVTFSDISGKPAGRATIGNGFVQSELLSLVSTALHDLLVGLMCFDRIYFPLHGIGKLHSDLGADAFWELINSDAFRFVWRTSDLAVVFAHDLVSNGAITCMSPRSQHNPDQERDLPEVLFAQLPAESSTDDSRANLLEKFEKIIVKFDDAILASHASLAQAALLFPRLRASIGLSDAIHPSKIPNWFVFPVLRVAGIVQDAEICRTLGASAAKMPFGSGSLANVTYGLAFTKHNASDYANYVVAGRFKTDLGAIVIKQPELLQKILEFRGASEGDEFRKEIFGLLQTNEGSEFVASVNSMLKSAVALDILERARDKFLNVHFCAEHIPLVSESANEADPFRLWRKRSAELLRTVCDANKIKLYDFCPCGSGDKLKFCCGALFKQ